MGLSPRRRGNPIVVSDVLRYFGSIPAQAGNPVQWRPGPIALGSIPAQAGEPATSGYPLIRPWGLSPRRRGTRPRVRHWRIGLGLSPRRRGNLEYTPLRKENHGSIPAQAGEPSESPLSSVVGRVYPRAGGGTHASCSFTHAYQGLSPRRRGNRCIGIPMDSRWGSIPAQAGEPVASIKIGPLRKVYPRAGGGTLANEKGEEKEGGLSPRRRGNPRNGFHRKSTFGSIPAQAGEPPTEVCDGGGGVYPRAGGGTHGFSTQRNHVRGLSPRRRGNPIRPPSLPVSCGSIPAQAGEPKKSPRLRITAWVYPRAGGGTFPIHLQQKPIRGLSPRRRGNLRPNENQHRKQGSIPAQAGEPGGKRSVVV